MPLVCFNVDKFRGEEVDCSPAARHRASVFYETQNLCKMPGLKSHESTAYCELLSYELLTPQ